MKNLFLITFLLLLGVCNANSTTNIAASASYTDVSNAVYISVSGDTVSIPAGGAGWTNTLTIQRAIDIIGSGTNSTFITNWIPSYAAMIQYSLTNGSRFRISGIYFDCNWSNGGGAIAAITRGYQDAWKVYNYISGFRIDHCVFDRCWYNGNNGNAPIEAWGRVWGVVDNCDFRDNVYCARLYGNPMSLAQSISYGWPSDCSGTSDWTNHPPPYYYIGTTNNFVMESCTIRTVNPDYSPPPNPSRVAISTSWSAHYVFRHNIVTNGFANGQNDILDFHGNKEVDGTYRGGICIEVYNNTIYATAEAYRLVYVRGGTAMVFSNSIFAPTANAGTIMVDEEETWNGVGPPLVAWPGMDQLTNSFMWANTSRGTNYSYPTPSSYLEAAIPNFFHENRDYWLRAPQSGDALENYVPLVYPHPLADATVLPTYRIRGNIKITGDGRFR